MQKQTKNLSKLIIAIAAMLLSACNVPSAQNPTEAVAAIYTAAAQTIEAQVAQATATPRITRTARPTNTSVATTTATATLTLLPASPTSITQNFCDNALFIADVTIPDNSVLAPGQVFDKTWTFQNTGTCTWTEAYTLVFAGGDLMNGLPRYISKSVGPQQMVDATVKLTAPNKPGTYTGIWRLVNGKGEPFGQISSVVIIVSADGATMTTTPETAITVTTGPTAMPSETATPTQPAEPNTPTASPTPTETPKP